MGSYTSVGVGADAIPDRLNVVIGSQYINAVLQVGIQCKDSNGSSYGSTCLPMTNQTSSTYLLVNNNNISDSVKYINVNYYLRNGILNVSFQKGNFTSLSIYRYCYIAWSI